MTKAEYMEQLQKKLERFGRGLKEEILEDYRQHFAEAEKQGKTEEEIIRELGNIEEMIKELAETDNGNVQEGHAPTQGESETYRYTGHYRAVELECDVADIELEPSADGQVSIAYEIPGSETVNRHLAFYQREEGEALYAGIKYNGQKAKGLRRSIHIDKNWFRLGNPVLKVKLPEKIMRLSFSTESGDICAQGISVDTLLGNTISGDVSFRDTSAKELKLNVVSGDLDLTGLLAEKLALNSASGDMAAEGIKTKTAQFSTASGDVDLKRILAERLSVQTASGNIDLKVTGPAEQANLNTVSGDISLQLEGVGGIKAEVAAQTGDAHISWAGERNKMSVGTCTFGDGSCKVTAFTRSGDLEIEGR